MEIPHFDAVLSFPVMVKSWEDMGFRDPISDKERIEEVKGAIQSINKFITELNKSIAKKTPEEIVTIVTRKSENDQYNPNTRKEMIIASYKREILNRVLAESVAMIESDDDDDEGVMTYAPSNLD